MYITHLESSVRGNRTLLNVILDVHMTNNGSYERSRELQTVDIALLRDKMLNWKKSDIKFDAMVLNLLITTLEEVDGK